MLRINKQMNMNRVAKYYDFMPYEKEIFDLIKKETSLIIKRELLVKKILKAQNWDESFVKAIVHNENRYIRPAMVSACGVEEEHMVEHIIDLGSFWRAQRDQICENSVEKV